MKRLGWAPATTWLIISAVLVSMCAGSTFTRTTSAQTGEQPNSHSALDQYAINLTTQALQRKIEPVDNFEVEIERVITSLANSSTKAPLLISQSDADRSAIARGVALRIALGNVPENLRGKSVYSLSLDALAKGAASSHDFEQRLQSVLRDAEAQSKQVILFIDQLHQYAGTRATPFASATLKSIIQNADLRLIAGSSPEAYAEYIASDDTVAKLFDSISIDRGSETATTTVTSKDKRRSPIDEEFEGEKISPDMRELMDAAGPQGRVNAIVQVSDVNNAEVAAVLKRFGIRVDSRMAELGALNVQLPVAAIEQLAQGHSTNYISPNVSLESFGHVTATTGTDQIRNAPGLLAGLLGATAIDGTGIGIAILDSGMDSAHLAFNSGSRIKFSKDFTGENNTTSDPYGHGSHVASSAAGAAYSSGTSFQ